MDKLAVPGEEEAVEVNVERVVYMGPAASLAHGPESSAGITRTLRNHPTGCVLPGTLLRRRLAACRLDSGGHRCSLGALSGSMPPWTWSAFA
jgi:hypothetical protein